MVEDVEDVEGEGEREDEEKDARASGTDSESIYENIKIFLKHKKDIVLLATTLLIEINKNKYK